MEVKRANFPGLLLWNDPQAHGAGVMQNQKGFTLVELAIVVGLMLLISAIALPSLGRAMAGYRLKSTARTVYNHFQQARIEAAKRNCAVVIALTPGTGSAGSYRLFADDGSGGGVALDGIQNGGEPNVIAGQPMPDDITLKNNFPGPRSGYGSKGLIRHGAGNLELISTGGGAYTLTLNNIGRVTLAKTN